MFDHGTFVPPCFAGELSPVPAAGRGRLILDDDGIRVQAFWAESSEDRAHGWLAIAWRVLATFARALVHGRQRPSTRPIELTYAWRQIIAVTHDPLDPTVIVIAVQHPREIVTIHFRPDARTDVFIVGLRDGLHTDPDVFGSHALFVPNRDLNFDEDDDSSVS